MLSFGSGEFVLHLVAVEHFLNYGGFKGEAVLYVAYLVENFFHLLTGCEELAPLLCRGVEEAHNIAVLALRGLDAAFIVLYLNNFVADCAQS